MNTHMVAMICGWYIKGKFVCIGCIGKLPKTEFVMRPPHECSKCGGKWGVIPNNRLLNLI